MPVTMTFTIDADDINSMNPTVHASPWAGAGKVRKTVLLNSMKDVADYTPSWQVYLSLTAHEKDVFRMAVGESSLLTRTVAQGKAMAHRLMAPPPPAMPISVPNADPIIGYTNDQHAFKTWLVTQADRMTNFESYLKFEVGYAEVLSPGTISVPIHISREGAVTSHTQFVFHYHPDASGPGVGSAEASTGHFKPDHYKPIRVKREDLTGQDRLKRLWKAARDAARKL